MKVFGALAALSAAGILSVAANAHATLTWVQEPGLATDIGVAANDMPWIVDINGVVQYGKLNLVCTPGVSICTTNGDVTWHALAGTLAHIGVSLDNSVIATDPSRGEVWVPQLFDGSSTAANNWMSGFDQWYGLTFYNTPGGPAASTGQLAVRAGGGPCCTYIFPNETIALLGISWSDSSVREITPGLFACADGGHYPEICPLNPYWTDTGGVAKEITLFSEVSGSLVTQTPWAVTQAGGLWFFNSSWVQVETPVWSTGVRVGGGVTYATDSWVLAGNFVWNWHAGANAERRTGAAAQDYYEVLGPPPSATLTKIAVAGAYPIANMPGSRIWALDTAHRIWVAEDLADDGSQ
jgi:hypothetical protein